MRTKWIGRIFMVLLAVLIFIAAGGQAVLHLWNWLLPPIFGWRELTFWQAVGILALCRILFGSFGGRPMWRSDFRRRMNQRWESMAPEEREKFRSSMKGGCGNFGAPSGHAKQQA